MRCQKTMKLFSLSRFLKKLSNDDTMSNLSTSDLEKGMPKLKDKFFVEKSGLDFDYASINTTKGINNHHSEFLIIEGNREAAKELLSNLIADKDIDWLKLDSKIYPIIFLIRHYLESILKTTLRYYRIIYDEALSDEVGYEKGHSLKGQWDLLKPYIERNYKFYDENLKDELLETNCAVDNIINEIDVIDKSSFSFRYSFEGTKSFTDKIKYSIKEPKFIDIQNLYDVFIKLTNYFEGVKDEAQNMLDEKQSNIG